MSTDSVGGAPAGLDQGGAQGEPQGQPQRAPAAAPAKPAAPQRARAGDFAPHQREREATSVVENLVPEDPDDPLSALVERSAGNAGAELAIHNEVDAIAELAKRDAARQRGKREPEVIDTEGEDVGESAAEVVDWESDEFKTHPLYPKFAELKAAADKLEGDQLHADLRAKFIPVELNVGEANGRPITRQYMLTVDDLARGFMRQSDYTKKLEGLYAYEDALQQRERGMNALVGALNSGDPETFMRMIRYIGALTSFQKAAYAWGAQIAREEAMSPEQRQVIAYNRQLQDELYKAKLAEENAQRALQAAQAGIQRPPSYDEQYLVNQLQQLLPRAKELLAKRGRPYVESDKANELLLSSWNTFLRTRDSAAEFTTESIANVLEGVMEQIEQLMAAGYIPDPQPRAAGMLPPVTRQAPAPNQTGARAALQAGAPNYGSNGRQPQRARIGDIGQINRQVR